MNAARWESVKSAFLHVTALPEESRDAYIASLRTHDEEVVRTVLELLSEDPGNGAPDIAKPCWMPPPQAPGLLSLRVGTLLAQRFEIVMHLGTGGTGEVYRAFDRGQREFVALKVLRPEAVPDSKAAQSLRKEVHTARLVSHPNVCRLHEFYPGDRQSPPFITMELLLGRTLQDRLAQEGRFAPHQAEPLIRQMLAGLEAAHGQGVVHRDFKPGNVMLVDNGDRAVLMDFGLAKDISPGTEISETITGNRLAGTLSYMAPEQLQGQPATPAADIHAFGVVVHEMLTGRRPFEGSNPLDVAARRLKEDAPRPLVDGRPLPRRWERVIQSCLQRDPGRRPASAAAIRILLEQPVPLFWGRRHLIGLLGATTIAAAGITAWDGFRRQTRSREEAALAHYLRGSKLLEEFSPASARAALVQFEEAFRLRPDYALAAAGKAEAYLYLGRVDTRSRTTHLAGARASAVQALRLDPQLADAHAAMAGVHQADWNWRQAETSYREALRLRPQMAKAHRWYCGLLLQFGRVEEAMRHARRALELDPDDRTVPGTIGFYYFLAGDNAGALGMLEPAVHQLDAVGKSDSTRFNLAQVYAWTAAQTAGPQAAVYFDKALRQAEIIRSFELSRTAAGPSLADQLFALIYVLRGEEGKAQPFVRRVYDDYAKRRIWVLPAAWLHALRGETDAAVTLLEQARLEHDAGLLYVKVMPLFKNLHSSQRFQLLLQQMGLNEPKEK